MIPRISKIETMENYHLKVVFDDGKKVIYDVGDDIETLPGYISLKEIRGLFENVRLDSSRSLIFWNDEIDLPSDIIYEYGKEIA